MIKYVSILLLVCFLANDGFSQSRKEKRIIEEARDDFQLLSSQDYPYIDKFHKALREKINKNYRESKELFLECLEERQDDDAVYFALAEIAKKERNSNDALEYFSKAYELDPDNVIYLQELAGMHYEKSNFEEAEGLFEQMVESDPRNPDFRYGYARVLIYNRSYKSAIEQLDKLQDQTGKIPDIELMKADLYIELKKYGKAEQTLLDLKTEFPKDKKVLKGLIGFYEMRKENKKATAAIEILAMNDPENGTAQYVLANNYLAEGEYEKFIAIAPTILANENASFKHKIFVFEQLKKLKDDGDEEDQQMLLGIIEKLYHEKPKDEAAAMNYAYFLLQNQETRKAMKIVRKTAYNNTGNYDIWERLLILESDLMEYDSLYVDGNEAIELFPSLPFIYFIASEGALRTNQVEEAEEILGAGEIYLLDNQQQEAYYALRQGEIKFQKKQYKEGIVQFEKAIQLDKNDEIKVIYAYHLAQANIAADIAKELLDEIHTQNQQSPMYIMAMALLAKNNDQLEKGIDILTEGTQQIQNSPEIYDLLGDFYIENKAKKEAVKMWEEAQKRESRNKSLSKKIDNKKYYAPKYY